MLTGETSYRLQFEMQWPINYWRFIQINPSQSLHLHTIFMWICIKLHVSINHELVDCFLCEMFTVYLWQGIYIIIEGNKTLYQTFYAANVLFDL